MQDIGGIPSKMAHKIIEIAKQRMIELKFPNSYKIFIMRAQIVEGSPYRHIYSGSGVLSRQEVGDAQFEVR